METNERKETKTTPHQTRPGQCRPGKATSEATKWHSKCQRHQQGVYATTKQFVLHKRQIQNSKLQTHARCQCTHFYLCVSSQRDAGLRAAARKGSAKIYGHSYTRCITKRPEHTETNWLAHAPGSNVFSASTSQISCRVEGAAAGQKRIPRSTPRRQLRLLHSSARDAK